MLAFEIAYWLGLVVQGIIRAPFRNATRKAANTDRRVSATEKIMLSLLGVFVVIVPGMYTFTNWLDFANYSLPAWMGWLGIVVLTAGLVVFWRSHADLGTNWSHTLEIRTNHTLVTGGIYRFIRHPMYASQFIWAFAQILLLQNWLAGPTNLLFFLIFYLLRVPSEEQMMVDTFGEEYRAYQRSTGGVIPKF